MANPLQDELNEWWSSADTQEKPDDAKLNDVIGILRSKLPPDRPVSNQTLMSAAQSILQKYKSSAPPPQQEGGFSPVATGIRLAGSFGGGILGGLGGTAIGGPAGTVAGSRAGAALGSYASEFPARYYESGKWPSQAEALTEGALGVVGARGVPGKGIIPAIKNVAKRTGEAFGIGGLGEYPRRWARGEAPPSLGEAVTAGAYSAPFGMVFGGAEKALPWAGRRLRAAGVPENQPRMVDTGESPPVAAPEGAPAVGAKPATTAVEAPDAQSVGEAVVFLRQRMIERAPLGQNADLGGMSEDISVAREIAKAFNRAAADPKGQKFTGRVRVAMGADKRPHFFAAQPALKEAGIARQPAPGSRRSKIEEQRAAKQAAAVKTPVEEPVTLLRGQLDTAPLPPGWGKKGKKGQPAVEPWRVMPAKPPFKKLADLTPEQVKVMATRTATIEKALANKAYFIEGAHEGPDAERLAQGAADLINQYAYLQGKPYSVLREGKDYRIITPEIYAQKGGKPTTYQPAGKATGAPNMAVNLREIQERGVKAWGTPLSVAKKGEEVHITFHGPQGKKTIAIPYLQKGQALTSDQILARAKAKFDAEVKAGRPADPEKQVASEGYADVQVKRAVEEIAAAVAPLRDENKSTPTMALIRRVVGTASEKGGTKTGPLAEHAALVNWIEQNGDTRLLEQMVNNRIDAGTASLAETKNATRGGGKGAAKVAGVDGDGVYAITLNSGTSNLTVENGVVTAASKKMHEWMVGNTLYSLKQFVKKRKGAKLAPLEVAEAPAAAPSETGVPPPADTGGTPPPPAGKRASKQKTQPAPPLEQERRESLSNIIDLLGEWRTNYRKGWSATKVIDEMAEDPGMKDVIRGFKAWLGNKTPVERDAILRRIEEWEPNRNRVAEGITRRAGLAKEEPPKPNKVITAPAPTKKAEKYLKKYPFVLLEDNGDPLTGKSSTKGGLAKHYGTAKEIEERAVDMVKSLRRPIWITNGTETVPFDGKDPSGLYRLMGNAPEPEPVPFKEPPPDQLVAGEEADYVPPPDDMTADEMDVMGANMYDPTIPFGPPTKGKKTARKRGAKRNPNVAPAAVAAQPGAEGTAPLKTIKTQIATVAPEIAADPDSLTLASHATMRQGQDPNATLVLDDAMVARHAEEHGLSTDEARQSLVDRANFALSRTGAPYRLREQPDGSLGFGKPDVPELPPVDNPEEAHVNRLLEVTQREAEAEVKLRQEHVFRIVGDVLDNPRLLTKRLVENDITTPEKLAEVLAGLTSHTNRDTIQSHLAKSSNPAIRQAAAEANWMVRAGLTDTQMLRHRIGHVFDTKEQAEEYAASMRTLMTAAYEENADAIPDTLYRTAQRQSDGKWLVLAVKSAWYKMKQILNDIDPGEQGGIEYPDTFVNVFRAFRQGFRDLEEKLSTGIGAHLEDAANRVNESVEDMLRRALHGDDAVPPSAPPPAGGGTVPPASGPSPEQPASIPPRPWKSEIPKHQRMQVPPAKTVKRLNRDFLPRVPSEHRAVYEQILDQFEDKYLDQRRRRQTIARSQALGQRVIVDLEKSTPPGKVANAEHAMAQADTAGGMINELNNLWEKSDQGLLTDADMIRGRYIWELMPLIIGNERSQASEIARALNAHKYLHKLAGTRDGSAIKHAADTMRGAWNKAMAEIKKGGITDPIEKMKIFKKHMDPHWTDKLRSYMFGNILAGPPSFARNFTGSAYNVGNEMVTDVSAVPFISLAKKLPQSILDKSPMLKKLSQGQLTLDKIPAEWMGMWNGMFEGMKDAKFIMEHGMNPATLTSIWDAPDALHPGRYDFEGRLPNWGMLKGYAGKQIIDPKFHPWNVVGRGLEATDAFFRSMFKHKYLTERSHEYATKVIEGKTWKSNTHRDEAFRQAMQQFNENIPEEVLEQAEHYAARNVYQGKPGKLGSVLLKTKTGDPYIRILVDMFIPFIRTAGNIMRFAFIEHSPLGFVKQVNPELRWAIESGHGDDVARALARATTGTLSMIGMVPLAAAGYLTGSTPRDPAAREEFFAMKKIPGAVKTPYGYVSHSMWGPLSIQAGMIASMFDEARRQRRSLPWTTPPNERLSAMAKQMTASAGLSIKDQSYLQGLENMVNAMTDVSSWGASTGAQVQSFLFPLSALVRRGMYAADPTIRKADTWEEGLYQYMPGAAQVMVPPRIDRFGHIAQRGGNPVSRFLSPAEVQSAKPSRLDEILERLNISVGTPSDRAEIFGQRSVKIPKPLRTAVQKMRGNAIEQAMAAVAYSPQFEQMSPQMQTLELNKARREALTQVNKQIKPILLQYTMSYYKRNAEQSVWRYMLFGPED